MNPVDTVLQLFDRINQRNADTPSELMTEHHVFIDSLGNQVRGRDNMPCCGL